ncbi:MAG: cytochrome c biogenesis protein CcsA [Edaphobacter sp.]|uniref:cytochrome c biogenesis protein CcsA n=1 Tax=Edaphobacter sp. TaxID=1934404 RepID=UPI0023941FD8|nr:cytochrome c biogenesis protein CcsA [Edaphobacter sp.]MDE1175895.1 cytochrome c biogenesis protein CcsA [Edaphobacter sp.]
MRRLFWMLFGFSIALLLIGFYEAVFVAPVEATMGSIYRIFYWHVPINISAEIFPYVNMLASIAFLCVRGKRPVLAAKLDALAVATAEVTVLYVGLGLITGMLWGRPVWGIWWTWDARLTSFLMLFLLYVSYLLVRRFSSQQSPVIAAVLSVFAGIDVPIVFMSIRWWRTQHPAPVLTGDGSLDRSMWPALLWNMAAWFFWGCTLIWARYAIAVREEEAAESAAMNALEA